MPLYDYRCSTCDQAFEIQHKMAESAPKAGPGCSRSDCCLEKQLAPVALIVRGPNPFVSKSGQPASTLTSPSPAQNTEEKSHTCSVGCAMHKH